MTLWPLLALALAVLLAAVMVLAAGAASGRRDKKRRAVKGHRCAGDGCWVCSPVWHLEEHGYGSGVRRRIRRCPGKDCWVCETWGGR